MSATSARTMRSARCRAISTGSRARSSSSASLPAAFRVLTDPVETGAVTISLPEDVQSEAFDWPERFFEPRVWHVRRPAPEPGPVADAVRLIVTAKAPMIVVGGGAIYSGASEELGAFASRFGIPVAETQAGKGAHPVGPPDERRARPGRTAGWPPTGSPTMPTSCSRSGAGSATS